jgi:hypothetical protein
MYAEPNEQSEVVSQAIFGSNVQLLEQKDGWAHIQTADKYTGWMPLTSLRADHAYAVGGRIAEVRCLFAHLYREPDVTRRAPLVTVPFETKLEVIAEQPDNSRWFQVRLPDDRIAWAQRGDLAFDTKPLSIPDMIELSKRFLGLPYTWGGTSSYGYDCSGFAQMLCRRRGVTLPRDSGLQVNCDAVVRVNREDMAPGDLLFFGSSESKVSHTGVYLGGGKFINATTYQTPTVRIDELKDPHWAELLVAVRRLR